MNFLKGAKMSILICNIEMPKNCAECKIVCSVEKAEENPYKGRQPSCPLIEVPKHGRLIDADALKDVCKEQWNDEYNKTHIPRNWARAFECFDLYVDDAPTIIEADIPTQSNAHPMCFQRISNADKIRAMTDE